MPFGLKEEEIKLLICVLQANADIEKAVIFGSRAMGTCKKNSDIDIALYGKTKIDDYLIKMQMDTLPLPYEFDVKDYNVIKNTKLKDHIDRVGKIIFERHG